MKRFRDVKCPALRAWNQLSYGRELQKSHDDDAAEHYFETLMKEEKENVLVIAARIHIKGYEEVMKEVMSFSK